MKRLSSLTCSQQTDSILVPFVSTYISTSPSLSPSLSSPFLPHRPPAATGNARQGSSRLSPFLRRHMKWPSNSRPLPSCEAICSACSGRVISRWCTLSRWWPTISSRLRPSTSRQVRFTYCGWVGVQRTFTGENSDTYYVLF